MPNKVFSILFIVFVLNGTLSAKDTFEGGLSNKGHADDYAKLLTGSGYVSYYVDSKLNILEKGLAHIMHLVVDSRIKIDREPYTEGEEAMQFLQDHQKELKINNVPNLRELITPGGNIHGIYSHLGWNHVYPETFGYNSDDFYSNRIYPNSSWLKRKKLLCDALGKIFDFGLFEGRKKDALGALLYYVHILGDHEVSAKSTAHTRLPIISMNEQGFLEWGKHPFNDIRWIPKTTIIDELQVYLSVLFSDQKHTDTYKIMMREIETFNVFTVAYVNEETNEVYHFTESESQIERAKYLLQILFNFCPYLLSREPFAKIFYKNYNINLF
jgi:hypothetical protein